VERCRRGKKEYKRVYVVVLVTIDMLGVRMTRNCELVVMRFLFSFWVDERRGQ
jgi:hypothetical protein